MEACAVDFFIIRLLQTATAHQVNNTLYPYFHKSKLYFDLSTIRREKAAA